MGTVTMWIVLAVVTILTCPMSLGQDEASEDIQLMEPRFLHCPEDNAAFTNTPYDYRKGITDWHDCGEICTLFDDCKFWSWAKNIDFCYFFKTSETLKHHDGFISG